MATLRGAPGRPTAVPPVRFRSLPVNCNTSWREPRPTNGQDQREADGPVRHLNYGGGHKTESKVPCPRALPLSPQTSLARLQRQTTRQFNTANSNRAPPSHSEGRHGATNPNKMLGKKKHPACESRRPTPQWPFRLCTGRHLLELPSNRLPRRSARPKRTILQAWRR